MKITTATLPEQIPNRVKEIIGSARTRGEQPDLQYLYLVMADLSKMDLRGVSLSGMRLTGVNLNSADLREADLRRADLSFANLHGADLRGANLTGATLKKANFSGADLTGANLSGMDLYGQNLQGTNLNEANLSQANLSEADLDEANLTKANLSGANLTEAKLIKTNLDEAVLTACRVYGIAAWNIKGEPKEQLNLIITPSDEPVITVDNIEVAQFIYLLLNNEKIRSVIDTIGKKGVLILGRFTEDRKRVLDAIREKLRALGFVPMMFDFDRPTQRDFTETIKILAGLSRFIIADITNPKSTPLELQATMPNYMIPFVPIIQENEDPFAMFRDLKQKYGDWVLDVLKYDSAESLVAVLELAVVQPALEKSQALLLRRTEEIRSHHVRDYR
jgi:hypothetical protein